MSYSPTDSRITSRLSKASKTPKSLEKENLTFFHRKEREAAIYKSVWFLQEKERKALAAHWLMTCEAADLLRLLEMDTKGFEFLPLAEGNFYVKDYHQSLVALEEEVAARGTHFSPCHILLSFRKSPNSYMSNFVLWQKKYRMDENKFKEIQKFNFRSFSPT